MEESEPPKRFKDFAKEHLPLDGAKLKSEIPFLATVKKIDKYFTFT